MLSSFPIHNLKSWRGLIGLISIVLTLIGAIFCWVGFHDHLPFQNYVVACVAFVPIVNFAGFLYRQPTLFIYSFGTMFYVTPILVGEAQATGMGIVGATFSILGACASFFNYPSVYLENTLDFSDKKTLFSLLGIGTFYLIGFGCLAARATQVAQIGDEVIRVANPIVMTACVTLVFTGCFFLVVIMFKMQLELYVALAAVAQLLVLALRPGIPVSEGPIKPVYDIKGDMPFPFLTDPVSTTGAVFAWFAGLGMLALILLRLHALRSILSDAASLDRARDRLPTWRGILAVSCALVTIIGAIMIWASHPLPATDYYAFVAIAAVVVAVIGYFMNNTTLYSLSFLWFVASFGPLVDAARKQEGGAVGVAGCVFTFLGMLVVYGSYPDIKFDKEVGRLRKIGVATAIVITTIGAICYGVSFTTLDVVYGNVPARAVLTCAIVLAAIFVQSSELYIVTFMIGMWIPFSMFGINETSNAGAARTGSVFMWAGSLIMAVSYLLKVISAGYVEENEKEYQPILPQTATYPAAVHSDAFATPSTASGPFGVPPPSTASRNYSEYESYGQPVDDSRNTFA